MSDAIGEAIEVLSGQQARVRWGTPTTFSTVLHLALLLLLSSVWELQQEMPLPPVHVLEINVMGTRDLALKGTGHDFGRGPLPDKSLLARPAKMAGKAVHGNTFRNSHSLYHGHRPGTGPKSPEYHPLTATGPVFSGHDTGGAEIGVGRDKIVAAPAATKFRSKARGSGDGGGDGIVGVPGGPIELKGRGGSGEPGGGSGNFLMGGEGDVNGGDTLERRGEPIVQDYHSATDDLISMKSEKAQIPSLSDDAFFSLRGPLSHRKILKIKLPRYPRWAEESGVEALVSVHLYVRPNGKVKGGAYIEQTSGYPQLDQLVLETIQNILFAPLADNDVLREEWGIATFNFKLKKGQKMGG